MGETAGSLPTEHAKASHPQRSKRQPRAASPELPRGQSHPKAHRSSDRGGAAQRGPQPQRRPRHREGREAATGTTRYRPGGGNHGG